MLNAYKKNVMVLGKIAQIQFLWVISDSVFFRTPLHFPKRLFYPFKNDFKLFFWNIYKRYFPKHIFMNYGFTISEIFKKMCFGKDIP